MAAGAYVQLAPRKVQPTLTGYGGVLNAEPHERGVSEWGLWGRLLRRDYPAARIARCGTSHVDGGAGSIPTGYMGPTGFKK